MDKIKFLIMVLTLCLLAACAPSDTAIQTAIAQTQTAIPSTATPYPTYTPYPTATIPPTFTPTQTPVPGVASFLKINDFSCKDEDYAGGERDTWCTNNNLLEDVIFFYYPGSSFSIDNNTLGGVKIEFRIGLSSNVNSEDQTSLLKKILDMFYGPDLEQWVLQAGRESWGGTATNYGYRVEFGEFPSQSGVQVIDWWDIWPAR